MHKSGGLKIWLFLMLLCGHSLSCSGQDLTTNSWDVVGSYTCIVPLTDDPPQSLFLFPDMSWDFSGPFTPKSVHAEWIGVKTRGWQGRILYGFKPPGIFSVESNLVRLYSTEFIENPFRFGLAASGLLRGMVKGFEQPSALPAPAPSTIRLQMLVRTFQFDERSERLVEVLPSDSMQLPVRCQRGPLFIDDPL
jgi:hypothetical protein